MDTSDRHIGVRDHFAILNIETSNIYQISIIAVASEKISWASSFICLSELFLNHFQGAERKNTTRVLEMKSRENSQKFMNHDGIDCLLIHNEIYTKEVVKDSFVTSLGGLECNFLEVFSVTWSLAVKLSGWRLTKSS